MRDRARSAMCRVVPSPLAEACVAYVVIASLCTGHVHQVRLLAAKLTFSMQSFAWHSVLGHELPREPWHFALALFDNSAEDQTHG